MARILSEETSLTRKRQAVLRETSLLGPAVKIEAAVAGLLLLSGVVLYFRSGSTGVFWLGIVLLVICAGHVMKIRENQREEKRVQAGIQGEARMTRLLAEKLDNTFYVINDFTIRVGRRSAQIDHLIVSPVGMFAIETKNWKGHIEGREDDDAWTQVREPGQPPLSVSNPIRQVRRHLEVLREALERANIQWPDIVSMVVFTSPRTSFYIHDNLVPVLKPDEAIDVITRYKPAAAYADETVTAAVNLFMRNA